MVGGEQKVFVKQGRNHLRWLLFVLYVALAISYMAWRTYVINWQVWYGPLAYLADLYGALTTGLFLWLTTEVWLPNPQPYIAGDYAVDVLIPTYNEPIEVLEPVILGALDIRGVRRVMVGDDTARDWLEQRCAELGVQYYPRQDNTHAKAGNMNNLLKHTSADLLICLDADHIPLPEFLEQTGGYFTDSKLAFVQTPQTFYNQDGFLFRHRRDRKKWSEQIMFYDCIQPAKNRWNSAFFVGTSAVLRREAVMSVGGFATGTATEDIHTSLKLHAMGWNSIFLPKPLAYGIESDTLQEFFKQRRRWAGGSLGLLFRSADSPLRAKGLSVAQRLNYVAATIAHLQGVQKLLYLLIPALTVITLQSPVHIDYAHYLVLLAAMTIVSISATIYNSRSTYHLLHTETFSLVSILPHVAGLWGIIRVQKKFAVSKKVISSYQRGQLRNWLWCLTFIAIAGVARAGTLYTDGNHSNLGISAGLLLGLQALLLGRFLLLLAHHETKPVTSLPNHPKESYKLTVAEYGASGGV